jgi:hypothetical protein
MTQISTTKILKTGAREIGGVHHDARVNDDRMINVARPLKNCATTLSRTEWIRH